MRLSYTFSVLLVTFLGLIAEIEAAPTRRSPPRLLTFSVRSFHGTNPNGAPPHVYLQQLMNRGEQRYARMTGREQPSPNELRKRLINRMNGVSKDGEIDATYGKIQKRHSRDEENEDSPNNDSGGGLQFIPPPVGGSSNATEGKKHHHHHHGQKQSNGGGLQFIPPPEGGVSGTLSGPDFVPFPVDELPGNGTSPPLSKRAARRYRRHSHENLSGTVGKTSAVVGKAGGSSQFVSGLGSDNSGFGDPFDEDGGSDDPFGQDGNSDDPFGQDGGSDDPFNQDGNSDDPFDQDGGSDDPFGQDGSSDDPFGQDGGSDDPFGQDGSSDDPFGQDGSSDDPFGQDGGFGDPSDESGGFGDPFDQDGGIQILPGPNGSIIIEPLSFNETVVAGNNNNTGVSQAVIQAALNGGITVGNRPSGNDSLGLNIEGPDSAYIATVQLGTPGRAFNLILDSGSSDLWVGSENCQAQGGGDCGSHQFLGPNSSSSFVQTQTAFQITYGTGHVEGVVVKDNLAINGLTLQQHTFGVANLESKDFTNDTSSDGLIGLGPSSGSKQKTLTVVEALAKAGLIPAPIVGYKLSRLADNKNDGEVTFGGVDTSKFDPSTLIKLPNVSQQGFWEATMDGVSVDGQDVNLKGRTAILDTGTTVIIAPSNDVVAIHKLIQGAKSDGQGGFLVPCTISQSISLGFGGRSFTIDPRDIAFLPVDVTNPTGDCSSAITPGQTDGATEWLVGDTFLKNAYFSTNVADNTVSLAKLI